MGTTYFELGTTFILNPYTKLSDIEDVVENMFDADLKVYNVQFWDESFKRYMDLDESSHRRLKERISDIVHRALKFRLIMLKYPCEAALRQQRSCERGGVGRSATSDAANEVRKRQMLYSVFEYADTGG
ncbi:unnamed protein product [Didymodactylos carnosus]|uniref:Uncharacterized protein n=1 Tax=Didymodactylos carnosus TaxID=1234261 RepID=A0A815KAK7_9BILA|nr:unnamed protein product [Didymodactylos carnosus]CAF1388555.1 unnamed protein product [Didymodactylos carnosus]CAF3860227.1 unnamed protein product [Didymodactylos carnosus]CAF4283292.1 unnamed protein product [Didymodactylos carnosus]